MSKEKYLFDANTFITAKNTFYSFDVVPSFWTQINELAEKEVFCIIDRVYDELVFPDKKHPANEDELSLWIRTEFKGKIISTHNTEVVKTYAQIIQKMTQEPPYKSHYKTSAKARFAEATNADAWLVAYAKVFNLTIVTFEKYTAEEKKNIKIPVVCREFGVDYINLHEFMRRMKMRI